MQDLVLNGKKYVKASDIAKDLGYTSDYVGQLCRSGKINAQLIGRSWYVDPSSIVTHKKSRYRTNTVKSKAAVESVTKKISHASVPLRRAERSKERHLAVTSYEQDTSELLPQVEKKSTRSTTSHADTQTVAQTMRHKPKLMPRRQVTSLQVESASKRVVFKAAEKPLVTFTGSLSVTAADEEVMTETVPPVSATTRSATRGSTYAPITQHRSSVISQEPTHRTVAIFQPEHEPQNVSIRKQVPLRKKRAGVQNGIKVLFFSMGLCLFVIALISLKLVWQYDQSGVMVRIDFDLMNVFRVIDWR